MIVHILMAGRPLCDRAGTPDTWGEDERWISFEEADRRAITADDCTVCKQRWTALKKLPRWRATYG